jgi:hypothetical protein
MTRRGRWHFCAHLGSAVTSKRSNAPTFTSAFWWLGLAAGAIVSSSVTVIVVVWEWLENPGGIFHSETGTNWEFVFDTAISWFIPTFVYATIIASVLHLAWSFIEKRRRKH